jgi:hypothetical protein
MADRFWVGGTGSWNGTNLTNWSTTSGGAGGASIPTASDNAYFDANSGGGTVTVNLAARTCLNLSFRGLSGTSDFTGIFTGGSTLNISGGLILSPSTTYNYSSTISFLATSGSYNITSNGKGLVCGININGLGGTFNLTDGINLSTSAGGLILTAGTLNLGSSIHSMYSFNSSNSNVRTLNFGTSAVNLTGNNATVFTTSTSTNLTVLGTNPTINCTYSGGVGIRTVNFGIALSEASSINTNISAGSDTVNFSNGVFKSINFTGFSGTASALGTIYKDLTLSPTQTFTAAAGSLIFAGTSTTQTITSNGVTMTNTTIVINSSTTTVQNIGSLTITGQIILTSGTFNTNGNLNIGTQIQFTAGTFSVNNNANVTTGLFISNNSNVRTLNMGSGLWTLTSTGNVWNIVGTNLTISAGTSRILITDTSATLITFTGGGLTYYTLEIARGSSTAINSIVGSNTFVNFIDNKSTAAHSIVFTATQTNSFYRFNVKGSAGNLITLNTLTGVNTYALVKLGQGIVNCDYLNIQHSVATPANTWYAGANSVNNQAVSVAGSGWNFTIPNSSQSTLGSLGVG